VSVNQVTEIPTTDYIINIVNNIAEQEAQPEGIEFSDMHGRITLQDFAANGYDEDSNASDDDFKLDEEYKEEVDNDIALDKEEGSVGNDDPDLQEDYFQNPIQQHNTAVANNNEPSPDILENCTCLGNNPVVTFTTTTKQECGNNKKRSIVEDGNAITEEDLEDDHLPLNSTKLGVGGSEDTSAIQDDVDSGVPDELKSDLGPYWMLTQSSYEYMLNTISSYNNVEVSKWTPQYGFNRGLKEFGQLGYEATVKELDDNLLGMGAVQMLKPSEISKNIVIIWIFNLTFPG
jgi:hypothetical protein